MYYLTNIGDKFAWKFTTNNEFSTKTVTWADNDEITPHSKAKLLNTIWQSNLFSCIRFFAWKLIYHKLFTKSRLRKFGSNIGGDCPFCNQAKEDIDRIFKHFTKLIWATMILIALHLNG